MKNRGQTIPINTPFGILLAVIFLILAIQAITSISCSNEKSEISRLNERLTKCETQVYALNQSLEDQKNLCNDLVLEEKEKCDLRFYLWFPIVKITNTTLIVSYVISITFLIFLSFHLFKGVIQVSFGDKIDRFIKKYETAWEIFKWILFLVLIIIFVVPILAKILTLIF